MNELNYKEPFIVGDTILVKVDGRNILGFTVNLSRYHSSTLYYSYNILQRNAMVQISPNIEFGAVGHRIVLTEKVDSFWLGNFSLNSKDDMNAGIRHFSLKRIK